MRKRLSVLVLLVLVSTLVVGCAGAAQGPAYPTKQVTYLVCFDPGGQSDRAARQQQAVLEKELGQTVAIDYKVGGGGSLGWSELARAKPDGYVMAGINVPHIILLPLQQETGFKTEQLLPINIFQSTPQGLAVLKTSKYKTLEELLAAAKATPGQITVGGSGTFTGSHMAMLWLEKLTGTKFNYVPFNGSAPQVTAFLGGHTDAMMANSDDLVKNLEASNVLALAHGEKFAALPNAPTFKEKGIDMVIAIDRGVAVPAGTPDSVVKKLEDAFLKIGNDAKVKEDYIKQGFVPRNMNAKESKEYVAKMTTVYKDLIASIPK